MQLDEESACSGFDTWAEATLVRKSRVKKTFRRYKQRTKVKFKGLGSAKELGEVVALPLQMRYGGERLLTLARVVEDEMMPEGVDNLFGTNAQRTMRMVYDCDDERIQLRYIGVVIDLEPVDTIRRRMERMVKDGILKKSKYRGVVDEGVI